MLAVLQGTARCKQHVNNTRARAELHQHAASPLAPMRPGRKPLRLLALKERIPQTHLLNGKHNSCLLPKLAPLTWPASSIGNEQSWTNPARSIHSLGWLQARCPAVVWTRGNTGLGSSSKSQPFARKSSEKVITARQIQSQRKPRTAPRCLARKPALAV